MRYGPYRIPPTSEQNIESMILNVQGMSNTLKIGAKKPCDGECTMLSLFADLEYADGTAANNANGVCFNQFLIVFTTSTGEVNSVRPGSTTSCS